MIFLLTALYHEAKPLINYYDLKPVRDIRAFQVFQGDEGDMALIVCGAGKASAAAAVGCICTYYEASEEDILINIGSAAALGGSGEETGGIFLCHKITDHDSMRTYYPDMLLRTEIPEAEILTVSRVLQKGDQIRYEADALLLADMESSAVWEAGMRFFAPHRIVFVKIVTDAGNGRQVTAKDVGKAVDEYMPAIASLVSGLSQMIRISKRRSVLSEPDQKLYEKLAEDLRCSETMRFQLASLMRYMVLEGEDPHSFAEICYDTGLLPCKSRREGKIVLEQIRNRLSG